MTSGAVPAGAARPNQAVTSYPGNPASALVGSSGSWGWRFALATASGLSFPDWMCGLQGKQLLEHHFNPTGNQIDDRRRHAFEGHVNDIDAGGGLEHLARDVRRRAAAAGSEVQLSRSCLGELDQLLQRARGQRRMNDDQKRRRHELADRRERLQRLVSRIRVETGRNAERGGGREEQRVAIRRRFRRGRGAYRAARARAVVDDHLLAQRRREMLGDGAADGSRWVRPERTARSA